jgi:glutathione synthase
MKIAFIVNDVATETAVYTTTSLAWTAHKREHDVYLIGVGDLSYSADEHMTAIGHKVPGHSYKSADTFLKAMKKSPATRISSVDLDVIFLRNDPSIARDGLIIPRGRSLVVTPALIERAERRSKAA